MLLLMTILALALPLYLPNSLMNPGGGGGGGDKVCFVNVQ